MQAYKELHLPAHKAPEMSDRLKKKSRNEIMPCAGQGYLFNVPGLEPTNTISSNLPLMSKPLLPPFQQNI